MWLTTFAYHVCTSWWNLHDLFGCLRVNLFYVTMMFSEIFD